MTDRRAHPSDLCDARWEMIESFLAAWRFERRGRALDFDRPMVSLVVVSGISGRECAGVCPGRTSTGEYGSLNRRRATA